MMTTPHNVYRYGLLHRRKFVQSEEMMALSWRSNGAVPSALGFFLFSHQQLEFLVKLNVVLLKNSVTERFWSKKLKIFFCCLQFVFFCNQDQALFWIKNMFSLGNKPTTKNCLATLSSIRVHVKALHYAARNTAVNSRTQEVVFCPKATGMKGLGHCRGKPHRSYMPMSRTMQTKQDTLSLLLGSCSHNKTPALIDLQRPSRFFQLSGVSDSIN